MDKNSITGFVLIAAILVGFTFLQNSKARKQMAIQAQADSIARVEYLQKQEIEQQLAAQSQTAVTNPQQASAVVAQAPIYKDALINEAASAEEQFVTLQNSKLEVVFTTKGAQPYSARVKDYRNYDSTDLYIFKPGKSEYSVSVYTGEYIKTSDFAFSVAELTDSSVVMRLPFQNGGYIEQRYTLASDSYSVQNLLSFVGLGTVIPRNVSLIDIDWTMTMPRMEKGYKNEAQYSKLEYYFDGDKKPSEMGRSRNNSKRIDSRLSWFAFSQQFFSAIVRAPKEFTSGQLDINFVPQEDESHDLMTCKAQMRADILSGQDTQIPLELYFGPNHYNTLRSYGQKYEKIIPLGGSLVGWITRFVIIPIFNFLHRFIDNFGLIILLMTIIIKIVVLPLSYKSYASSAKMAALRPEIEKINARYPKQDDAMKKQQATMELYKRAGVNTLGGCLPMLLQFPVLWAMFRFFPASIELRQQHFLWADDLSGYDSIINFGARIPLLGDHLSLFALLMAVTMFFYSKYTFSQQPSANDPNAKSMQLMSVYMMPIMMFFICNGLSAALSYYYLLSNIITMIETFIIRKWCVDPEAILARVKASEGKPIQKSKWQLRLEEAQKMQQAQMREQQKKNRR